MRILVVHPGALGDIILSLKALRLLREGYPNAHLTLAGNIDYLPAVSAGYADQLLSIATLPLHRLYSPEPLPMEDLRYWRSFDRVLSWTGSGNEVFASQLAKANPVSLVRSWKPVDADTKHVSRIFVESLIPWISAVGEWAEPRIRPPGEEIRRGEDWLQQRGRRPGDCIIAIHPGAGSLSKQWPLGRFLSLARAIVEDERMYLVFLAGPAETGMADYLERQVPTGRTAAAESLPLALIAGVLYHCEAYVGNDSGISHLAAALGTRSVVLFGPTSPHQWAPPGAHVSVLWDQHGCEACVNRGSASEHTCLGNIGPDQVLAVLRETRDLGLPRLREV